MDIDDETQREMVVSLVTQYRILKFVSINVKETQMLRKPLRDLTGVGTYENLAVAYMDTPVMDVIHLLVKKNISCVPIVDRDGTVLNVFEAVDVITLINGGDYEKLNYSAGKALELRSSVRIIRFIDSFISRTVLTIVSRTSLASTPAQSTIAWTPSSTPSAAPACTVSSSLTSRNSSKDCFR